MLEAKESSLHSYRHGDVLLVRCARLPDRLREEVPDDGRIVIARGEQTGHAHTMPANRVCYFREDGSGSAFIRVLGDAPAELTHEEHAPLMIPPGDYRVIQQREYLPQSPPRSVFD